MLVIISVLITMLIAGVMLNIFGSPLWAVFVLGLVFILSGLAISRRSK